MSWTLRNGLTAIQHLTIQPQVEEEHSTKNAWDLTAGSDIGSTGQAGLDHEWPVTNGLGGYAADSVVG